jgi:hypothetical protein
MVRIETALNAALWANKGGYILFSAFLGSSALSAGMEWSFGTASVLRKCAIGAFYRFWVFENREFKIDFPKKRERVSEKGPVQTPPPYFLRIEIYCPIAYNFRTRLNRDVKLYFTT